MGTIYILSGAINISQPPHALWGWHCQSPGRGTQACSTPCPEPPLPGEMSGQGSEGALGPDNRKQARPAASRRAVSFGGTTVRAQAAGQSAGGRSLAPGGFQQHLETLGSHHGGRGHASIWWAEAEAWGAQDGPTTEQSCSKRRLCPRGDPAVGRTARADSWLGHQLWLGAPSREADGPP